MVLNRESLKVFLERVSDDKLVKHMLAVEAIMRGLAKRLGEDEDLWGITGLLHDIDYEETKDNPSRHGLVSAEILREHLPEEAIRAIMAHNERTGIEAKTKLDIGLRAADALSGLIVACALVMPNKKIEEVKLSTLKKKFKSKDFARGVDREKIKLCEKIGLELDEFLEIGLKSMKSISDSLGL